MFASPVFLKRFQHETFSSYQERLAALKPFYLNQILEIQKTQDSSRKVCKCGSLFPSCNCK